MGAGRKRTFNQDDVLLKAMSVFWQKGYSGASITDLTKAMGVTKPSLYTAFGSKEGLFKDAIRRYVELYGTPYFDVLLEEEVSLKDRVKLYLESIVKMLTDTSLPGGCFVTNSTCEAGSQCLPEDTESMIFAINKTSVEGFTHLFNEEKEKGNLPEDLLAEGLSDFLLSTQFGLAVMARNGADAARLNQVISYSLASFESKV